jgi:hypothetical protein
MGTVTESIASVSDNETPGQDDMDANSDESEAMHEIERKAEKVGFE